MKNVWPHCIRNHLKTKFSNWTSGNDSIDDLLQKCQLQSLLPDYITEHQIRISNGSSRSNTMVN